MSKSIKVRSVLLAAISLLTIFSVTACSAGRYGSDQAPKTSKYILDNFEKTDFLDPFKNGNGDIGSTMEAVVQLSGVGYKEKLVKVGKWLSSNTDQLTSAGLKGQYLFAAQVLEFETDPTVAAQLEELKLLINSDGSIKEETNNFSVGLVVFGLLAAEETDLAVKVALHLVKQIEPNGGVKYYLGDMESGPAADVTGLVIMALQAAKEFSSGEDKATLEFAVSRTSDWLIGSSYEGRFWLGDTTADVSGTAYAIMALSALGENFEQPLIWLKEQINAKDNGVVSAWSAPNSDIFTTNQSILALSKLSFIDVLNNTK
ncbi:MAG: hypothetical protein ACK5GF_02670 [Rhodoluna sp.]|jgi:hypothetical protein